MKVLLVTFVIIGVSIVNGASLQKPQQRIPSEYNEKTCPRRCSEIYHPICGINELGETKVFVNDCYMSFANCDQPEEQVYRPTDGSECDDLSNWLMPIVPFV